MEEGEEGDYYTYRGYGSVSPPLTGMTSCIKMAVTLTRAILSVTVSLIVRDKVTRQCPQTTILEVKGEPKQIRHRGPSAGLPWAYRGLR